MFCPCCPCTVLQVARIETRDLTIQQILEQVRGQAEEMDTSQVGTALAVARQHAACLQRGGGCRGVKV